MARDASVMPEHLNIRWCACVERGRGKAILCKAVYHGFGWFDKLVVYNDARLVVDDADPGQFLAVFCQTLCRVE
jgi:hypothetical protein